MKLSANLYLIYISYFLNRYDAFLSNAYLEKISIESNPKLKTISLVAFSRLPYLKYLSLKNNSIEDVLFQVNEDSTRKTRYLNINLLNI